VSKDNERTSDTVDIPCSLIHSQYKWISTDTLWPGGPGQPHAKSL